MGTVARALARDVPSRLNSDTEARNVSRNRVRRRAGGRPASKSRSLDRHDADHGGSFRPAAAPGGTHALRHADLREFIRHRVSRAHGRRAVPGGLARLSQGAGRGGRFHRGRAAHGFRHCHDDPDAGRKAPHPGRTVRGVQGPARRLLDRGLRVAGCRARVGCALPGGRDRGRRGAADGRRLSRDGRQPLIPMADARGTVEAVARSSYGRLLAYLSSQRRDVDDAEDALGEALLAALESWPREGIPRQPEAWLLTVARHRLVDRARRARVRMEHALVLQELASEPGGSSTAGETFPDRRVELLFVCAHPAIDPSLHAPLMLQTVLGLDAARIAQAFLVAPTTIAQRLVRAKRKIRDAGIPFRVPAAHELPARLEAVLEAIYGAYDLGHDEAAGADTPGKDLVEEAIWLARVVRERMPDEAEVRGLLALMLFSHARRAARTSPDGRYVPLSEQDPSTWSAAEIDEAEAELAQAARLGRIGRFQLEAAIQSVHADRARSGHTDWSAIVMFYDRLTRVAPTLGARVAQAAAVAEASGPAAGLSMLDAPETSAVKTYQPYWAVRAHLLRLLNRRSEAAAAFDRAIGLTEDPAVRRFLIDRRG